MITSLKSDRFDALRGTVIRMITLLSITLYHLFGAQKKAPESSDEAFLCGDNSERHAAIALAASELDMAISDRRLS